ncbi:COX15/CtaA family protein, partial [Pelagibacteraceae bacterium]|nr:COX15/CtaA family protein [Pelagibacteraceae bacterium]
LKLFYNSSIIQFFHRVTAYILFFSIIFLNYSFFKYKLNLKNILIFDIAILLQIFLGIITLVSGVEIKYASLHQLGSIFVLCSYLLILYKNPIQQL